MIYSTIHYLKNFFFLNGHTSSNLRIFCLFFYFHLIKLINFEPSFWASLLSGNITKLISIRYLEIIVISLWNYLVSVNGYKTFVVFGLFKLLRIFQNRWEDNLLYFILFHFTIRINICCHFVWYCKIIGAIFMEGFHFRSWLSNALFSVMWLMKSVPCI